MKPVLISLIVLIVICFITIFHFFNSNFLLKKDVLNLREEIGYLANRNDLLKDNVYAYLNYSSLFDLSQFEIQDISGMDIEFSDIYLVDNVYLYFDVNHCGSCVQKEILYIKSLSAIDRSKITILINQPSFRQFKSYYKASDFEQLNISVFYVKNRINYEGIDYLNHPLLFTLNPDLTFNVVLTAKKEFPDLSKYFYDYFLSK